MSETTHNKEGFTVGYYLRKLQSFLMTILKNQKIYSIGILILDRVSTIFIYTYPVSLSLGWGLKGFKKRSQAHYNFYHQVTRWDFLCLEITSLGCRGTGKNLSLLIFIYTVK